MNFFPEDTGGHPRRSGVTLSQNNMLILYIEALRSQNKMHNNVPYMKTSLFANVQLNSTNLDFNLKSS